MDQLVTSLLMALNEQDATQTAHNILQRAGITLCEQLGADIVVCHELIPETGGVPKLPPLYFGGFLSHVKETPFWEDVAYQKGLNNLIYHWKAHYEKNAEMWSTRQYKPTGQTNGVWFIKSEKIKSFIFLPVNYRNSKLAAVIINYRSPKTFNKVEQQIFDSCGLLIGSHLAQVTQQANYVQNHRTGMAIAHTLYGEVALILNGQLETLRNEITKLFGVDNTPTIFTSRLEEAKSTVFEILRKLVLEASGEMLVDLESTSLAKALNTVTAALRRAWPREQRVTIEVQAIPLIIERQPSMLRKLLYVLILEAIGNAIKHGGPAPYIRIELNWSNNKIYVQIIDHGQGFDPKMTSFSEYGLGFWQTYVTQHLGGTFQVSSQPGFGTVITATIPIIPSRAEYDAKRA